ncbi:deoxyribose-phosphate aldolase [Acetanaerobacterium sp. MSJ-12]|uniref:Deoxyribose-phosphate aldolase n=1 Tax=Bittarella massiliensis (ex Durand et al. 2017) TaxID=1720313 RepID=A0AAP1PYC0_9FIRM|nr:MULTISPECIES: deoxyribose-phosphate aldolase [Eubacteriales]MCB5942581.1 deoxyribose-phosphate aldolase [bacterium 210820-DFI.6.52]ERI96364.1 deoxyribose-phosphate aldolase [Clostridium sp. ATCC 29733]MBC2872226.1 deoxyribose-phosphate aldolase [Bittarella massiliensis (ex Durand et al. 2017)]MBU5420430.1 deoxyribose-phosphate aldolase [Acetanaerobacterium sp. MSJ-12]MCQ4949886.1 deoxyribose-phosphate aldolase [Bittarella massiliensis (ex Durand et al. 2017)]
MTQQEILAKVDHTLLKPESTWAQIKQICDDAIEYKTASICINPCYVKRAVEYLNGRVPVCTVIGFPLGATPTAVKVFEAKQALADGAEEFDMVINIGALKDGDYEYVKQDIAALKEAVGDHVLKVIIETCLLTDEEKEKMCDIVVEAGADFIKTSTGFSTAGATFHDIELFNRCVAGRCKIKAAGGIKSVDDMEKFISLGADRLGTSSAIKLLKNQETGGAY